MSKNFVMDPGQFLTVIFLLSSSFVLAKAERTTKPRSKIIKAYIKDWAERTAPPIIQMTDVERWPIFDDLGGLITPRVRDISSESDNEEHARNSKVDVLDPIRPTAIPKTTRHVKIKAFTKDWKRAPLSKNQLKDPADIPLVDVGVPLDTDRPKEVSTSPPPRANASSSSCPTVCPTPVTRATRNSCIRQPAKRKLTVSRDIDGANCTALVDVGKCVGYCRSGFTHTKEDARLVNGVYHFPTLSRKRLCFPVGVTTKAFRATCPATGSVPSTSMAIVVRIIERCACQHITH